MLSLNIACLYCPCFHPPDCPDHEDMQFVYENTVILAYHFRSNIPPFVKARTVLEGLKAKHEETVNVKADPSPEVSEVIMIKVLVMNQSFIKLQ